MDAIHQFLTMIQYGFFVILAIVAAFMLWRERKNAQNSWKPVSNLRSFPKSEAERIAEFRREYVRRVGAR